MTLGRTSFIGLRTAILALCLLWAASLNAEYPEKPVEYVIPFGAGGESGVTARLQQLVIQKLTNVVWLQSIGPAAVVLSRGASSTR